MQIGERIYKYLEEKGMSQAEFVSRTGISQSTVSDWKIKKNNPSSDKIMVICKALDISPYELLTGTEDMNNSRKYMDYVYVDKDSKEYTLIETYQELSDEARIQMIEQGQVSQHSENNLLQDGAQVKYAGIITSIKKKFTKSNKLMAFVTIEDLYGQTEIIVFENCYQNCSSILFVDNIVLVDGRLSVREDEDTKIVAREIKGFGPENIK